MRAARVLLAFAASSGIVCCGEEPENAAELAALDESEAAWEARKASGTGDYAFGWTFSSWTGFYRGWSLTVVDDLVVMRTKTEGCQDYQYDECAEFVADNWCEEGDDVGSHADGCALALVEDLYRSCREDVLSKSPDENDIYLAFDDDGILVACTYFPKNCADDCAVGVWIGFLDWLAEKDSAAEHCAE